MLMPVPQTRMGRGGGSFGGRAFQLTDAFSCRHGATSVIFLNVHRSAKQLRCS